MATPTSGDSKQLLAQLVALTDAVKQLAERPAYPPAPDAETEADRIRQRVAFGYRALGALTGRVSSASGNEFDVPVVEARRERAAVAFRGLPPGADWVELRRGTKVEVLRILDDDQGPHSESSGDGGTEDSEGAPEAERDTAAPGAEHARRSDRGLVRPRDFADTEPIGSIVFLRRRRGPLVAFGPRLAPLPTRYPHHEPA